MSDSDEQNSSLGKEAWVDALADINQEFGASVSYDNGSNGIENLSSPAVGAEVFSTPRETVDDVFWSTKTAQTPTLLGTAGSGSFSIRGANTETSAPLINLDSTVSQGVSLAGDGGEEAANSGANGEQKPPLQQPNEKDLANAQRSALGSPWTLTNERGESSPSTSSPGTESTNSEDGPKPIQDAPAMPSSVAAADTAIDGVLIDSTDAAAAAPSADNNDEPVESVSTPNAASPSKPPEPPQDEVKASSIVEKESSSELLIQFSATESQAPPQTPHSKPSPPKSCLSPSSKLSPSKGSGVKTSFAELETKKSISFDQHTPTVEQRSSAVDQDELNSQMSGSAVSDVSDLISRFTQNNPSMDDLDDILGPIGTESVDGHSAVHNANKSLTKASTQSTPTTTVEPKSEAPKPKTSGNDSPAVLLASQKELNALTNTTKSQPDASPQPPSESLAELKRKKEQASLVAPAFSPQMQVVSPAAAPASPPQYNPLESIVASLEKNLPPMGPKQTPPHHQKKRPPAINPMGSDSTGASYSTGTGTFDSSSSETSPSVTPGSAISKDSASSFWASSRGTGTSRDGSCTSPGTAGTRSPKSPGTAGTRSPGGTTAGSSSCPETTIGTRSPVTTVGSPDSTVVSRSPDSLTRNESGTSRSGPSMSASFGLRPVSTSKSENLDSPMRACHTSRSDQQESTAHSESPSSAESESGELSDPVDAQGGRLWQKASEEAGKSNDSPVTPEASKFAESLMARTRSRAEPDSLISSPGSQDHPDNGYRPAMIRLGDHDDAFIVNTALARKRVRVVQLLVVGLVGVLVGLLGSFYVQSSCHFVTVTETVGTTSQIFLLHYGLWKYSPMDSVFQGYSYCDSYDNNYTSDAPMLPRLASCIALAGGLFALCVLWFYLIFGRTARTIWRLAVVSAGLSGILQLCTLSFFMGEVCDRDECTLGPAGVLSVVASVVWFILAFEMHYNTPLTEWIAGRTGRSHEVPRVLVGHLEMTDLKDGAKAYVLRLVKGEEPAPYPTLNQIQRDNALPIGEVMLERNGKNDKHYKPPALIV